LNFANLISGPSESSDDALPLT